MKHLFCILLFLIPFFISAQESVVQKDVENINDSTGHLIVYKFDIKEEIAPPVWRTTQRAFEKANEIQADIILIHMNTYGGMVDAADSIRTKILNSKIPVYVLIDNNAASAGALISIACDSIYMVSGSNMGAATVANQTGEAVPDKYQSYMRSMMRSTAEVNGRDPMIAQAMVDPNIYIPEISDSAKVLTFTVSEAIKYGFCEGKAETVEDVLKISGNTDYELITHEISLLDIIINFLINPTISGLLIMMIIGGIYFELQSPGIGFPLVVAILGALLYFAPHYLEGLASNWEILLFAFGIILLLIEIFALSGFGIAGISGIICIILGLSFAMVDNYDNITFELNVSGLIKSFSIVILSVFVAIVGSFYLSKRLFTHRYFGKSLSLDAIQDKVEGFTSANDEYSEMIDKQGTAYTILRPSGKIKIGNEIYDATAQNGFIDEGSKIKVIDYQTGQLIVNKIE